MFAVVSSATYVTNAKITEQLKTLGEAYFQFTEFLFLFIFFSNFWQFRMFLSFWTISRKSLCFNKMVLHLILQWCLWICMAPAHARAVIFIVAVMATPLSASQVGAIVESFDVTVCVSYHKIAHVIFLRKWYLWHFYDDILN